MAELGDDFWDEATFAFVSEADADIGDELAAERREGHARGSSQRTDPGCRKAKTRPGTQVQRENVRDTQRAASSSGQARLRPALFTETHNRMRINREEIFGPVASVERVHDVHVWTVSSGLVTENAASALYRRFTSWGPIRGNAERAVVDDAVARLQVDTRAQSQVRRLSGGNQQKVTIARWVAAGFDVLLCFDPTRGIDVGTKRQIYDLVRSFADAGKAVLLFTSELQEIPLACDRVVVLHAGQVSAEMDAADADEETLLKACHGLVAT